MALPRLNETIKYNTKIPSTGQEIRYRPFLIKEEKVLLLAMESQDSKMILNSILDTIAACVDEEINFSTLPVFDIEYIFLQIRSKSVGENSDVKIKCKSCSEYNDISINLEDIKITVPKKKKIIELDTNISLEMKYPSIVDVMNSGILEASMSETERTFESIGMCIEAVLTEEERLLLSDEPKEEIDNFINSLNTKQYNEVKKFVDRLPQLRHKVEFDCEKCEEHNTINLRGTDDFF